MEGKTELQKNFIAFNRRKELDLFQRALDVQWLNSRMEDGRMGRCLALIQREADMEKEYRERTDHAAIVNARAAKETALGIEVAKVRREEACQLLRRHYLRERDAGLKELTKKLQAGYVCRDLRQQILHNEYRRLQEKAEENRANSMLRNALYSDQEQQEREEREKMERNTKYCQELQQQLVNRQLQRQCQYEERLIEKTMLDDIMRTIADEDQKELAQKRDLMEKSRVEMVKFKEATEAWKRKQTAIVIEEEAQIEAQQRAASDRSASIITERERRMKIKEEINERIAAKIMADEEALQERRDTITLLQQQEYLEKNVQDDIAEKEKSVRTKRDTKEALTNQMNMRKQREKEQREKDAIFRKETEAKIEEENAKEREKKLKLREKNRRYSMELLKQAEAHKQQLRDLKQNDEMRAKHVREYDEAWRAEVTEERKKIIEEHVPHLLGYLQAGVIKKEDLPYIRQGANKHEELAKLDIEAMATSKQPQRFSKCNAQCLILREY